MQEEGDDKRKALGRRGRYGIPTAAKARDLQQLLTERMALRHLQKQIVALGGCPLQDQLHALQPLLEHLGLRERHSLQQCKSFSRATLLAKAQVWRRPAGPARLTFDHVGRACFCMPQ